MHYMNCWVFLNLSLIANSLFNTIDLQAVIIIISVATALRGGGRTL